VEIVKIELFCLVHALSNHRNTFLVARMAQIKYTVTLKGHQRLHSSILLGTVISNLSSHAISDRNSTNILMNSDVSKFTEYSTEDS